MAKERFFHASGEPVDPERVEQELKRYRIPPWQERSPEFKAFLEKVQLPVLRQIFVEYAEKAGVEEGDVNFLPADRIGEGALFGGGSFDVQRNTIELSTFSEIEQQALKDLMRMRILTHEEGHAVAGARCVGLPQFEKKDRSWYETEQRWERQNGYKHSTATQEPNNIPHYAAAYEDLDEGINDKFAQGIFKEYLARDPNFATKAEQESFDRDETIQHLLSVFPPRIQLVNALVERISREAEVPHDVVWGGFIRGLFEGVSFDAPEMREAFKDVFSEEVFEKLRNTKTREEYEQLLEEIRGTNSQVPPTGLTLWDKLLTAFEAVRERIKRSSEH